MMRIRNFLYKKPSFIYHTGKKTFKVFTPKGMPFKLAEVEGNRSALKSKFWSKEVIEVKPALFYLKMKRGVPLSKKNWREAERFIELKLQQAATFPQSEAHLAYDFTYLRQLEDLGLGSGLLSKAEEFLKAVYLPATSAHGDLHLGNMVFIEHEIKVIDWSMFTSTGSFVTDYIHFYNCNNAKKSKESWTQSILKNHKYLETLASMFGTEPNCLRLAYAMSRISGEIRQRESMRLVTSKEIIKYNYVLNHILNESKEALVQRSNSSI